MTTGDPPDPAERPPDGGPDPAMVAAWGADAAIEERRRRSWARRRLDDELSLAATLLSRAEDGRPVSIEVVGGRRLTGHLWWVGPGGVAVHVPGVADALVDLAAVVAVRDAPGRGARPFGGSPREVTAFGDGTLLEALAGLVGDEPQVAVHGRQGAVVATGTLVAAGRDVVAVDEAGGSRALVAAHALGWVLVAP